MPRPRPRSRVVTPPLRRVRWPKATRIVPARYPPVVLYERISPDPAVWEALLAAEELVSPRQRGPVMAAFTHLTPGGSRFSDGTYGVYYAATDIATAVAETAFHFEVLATDSADGPRYEDMRVVVARVDSPFHDVERLPVAERAALLNPASYAKGQSFARSLRDAGSNGVHYASVRRAGGRCLAVFRPETIGTPAVTRRLKFSWDGIAVRRYFDYVADRWMDV